MVSSAPHPPRWDRTMRQRLARGEEAALGELYDRYASVVHGIAHRITADEDAADLITREVFGCVWENPAAYDPKRGSLRSWLAGLAQRQAVRRLRQDGRRPEDVTAEDLETRVREATTAARADYIVTSMPAPLRDALDLTYRRRLDYRQAAADLGVTEDEARRRLRLGLQLLSSALNRPSAARGNTR
jgi:RNA polymerase sigma-70 factor, ECF subfamily